MYIKLLAHMLSYPDRFHAWQSALLFTAILVLHFLFAWSSFISWLLFLGDIALVALLVMRTYRDAETLDRFVIAKLRAQTVIY